MKTASSSPVVLLAIAIAFAGGALSAQLVPRANAQAQPAVLLPPIFEEGARLLGPTGVVELHEVMGGWVRVKSLSALAKPGEELWMNVLALPGAWTVSTEPVAGEKKR
ncbi:MAG: hypothetical protein FJY92_09620 [Candidatus Hydrogenedentes bacterium]|nr:hypothetical protein [Candidatus Hydrogenedentota bacterium]